MPAQSFVHNTANTSVTHPTLRSKTKGLGGRAKLPRLPQILLHGRALKLAQPQYVLIHCASFIPCGRMRTERIFRLDHSMQLCSRHSRGPGYRRVGSKLNLTPEKKPDSRKEYTQRSQEICRYFEMKESSIKSRTSRTRRIRGPSSFCIACRRDSTPILEAEAKASKSKDSNTLV